MLNAEKWKDKILKILESDDIALVNDVPKHCAEVMCSECEFGICDCYRQAILWMLEESEE